MGATRKLQGEIDRVLKKVQEGVDVFDSIWNKVYDTENANQKEKFEADLKKEIKKLQRYRDQIKTWIQSSEIKDKKVAASYEQALLDARKLIEREMERFKVCEKETKTKAFSKEGLGQQPKTDPREKAKGESRDWLNNNVSELESQVDSFEAEMEGLSVKKGKARPPRLTHLEESISRHKQHIIKLELILRLLDNDELSPEEVNDVRDFVEDYVDRNQDDFEDFSVVDDLYQSLPLEKMEALESLDATMALAPPVLVKEKVASAAEPLEEGALPEPTEDIADLAPQVPATVLPPTDEAAVAVPVPTIIPVATEGSVTGTTGGISVLTKVGLIPASTGVAKAPGTPLQQPPPVTVVHTPEDGGNMVDLRDGLNISEAGVARISAVAPGSGAVGLGPPLVRGSLSSSGARNGSVVGGGAGVGVSSTDGTKRAGLVGEERAGNVPLHQQLAMAQSRMLGQFGGSLGEATSSGEVGALPDGGSRVFSPPVASTGQWRHLHGSQIQEQGQHAFTGRPEVAPDLKQKFLQRLQQVQQNHSAMLNANVVSKQQTVLSSQQQNSLKQQTQLLHQQPQVPLLQPFQTTASSQQLQQLQQQTSLVKEASSQLLASQTAPAQPPSPLNQSASQLSSQASLFRPGSLVNNGRTVEQQAQSGEESAADASILNVTFSNSVSMTSEDDVKNHDTFDVTVGGPGSLGDFRELPRDVEFSSDPIVPLQSSAGLGVIGRRDNIGAVGENVGAIGDNPLLGTSAGIYDQQYNMDALASAYLNMPLPQDSERPKNYVPRNPAVSPSSYPQVRVPIVDNPALWEHLDTEILFFAFYFQQGTYQQYMAARELKRQSWRYHKKYNTWFQRHEEPKITTDEFEQGTYVYFDFHIVHDDHQQGWCQRIKTEFTFEYSYLEDELIVG